MDDGVDDDGGGAPAAASATLSFSMRMAIPCDGRASYFLTQAQGGRWGLIDVGAVYKRAGLGGDRWTRSSVAVSLRGGPGALGGRNTTAYYCCYYYCACRREKACRWYVVVVCSRGSSDGGACCLLLLYSRGVASMYAYVWMNAGGGVSREKGRIGQDRIIKRWG